ncbi:UDP-2,3-diacylglucosamine diphosphatase [Chitiniphilus purpureus]|uniref:UDP-2,3-diacylglucosamine hydrolase n=1 Tax=Chitiniphilus purpureus TaxID=2981137 RepID=A0ABY6DRL1_9NEIS|nr:UDP-2,3-diacylglucosamine diphosphatase [Chitiniphilus sp. CD1]UXY16863.1 UDP-2,3-diacylglucosamine diphosphatase [Chitiniphilus sp. CD1]
MPRPVLLISDLHLSPADPATAAAFAHFADGPAREAAALYILGDLFEVWIGDDQLREPFYAAVAARLTALGAAGVPVYFMPGNRDFLCGARFAQVARLTLLPDPTVIAPFGTPLLLMHGDTLCTDDAGYQRFRRVVRNRMVQWLWRHLPYGWRNREAGALRARSQAMNRGKASYVMDVNRDAVTHAMQAAGVALLVHGHTHRPARHNETSGTRWVLPDWHEGQGGLLRLTQQDARLLTLAGEPLADPAPLQPPG